MSNDVSGKVAITDRGGLLYGVAAYGFGGLTPLYFRSVQALQDISPFEFLAHRIVWCAVLLTVVLGGLGRWAPLRNCLRSPRLLLMLSLSTVLIALNWYAYLQGTLTGQIEQASLGYFMIPLVNVALGVLFFGEELRPTRWLALGLAATGLVFLVVSLGELPWIALVLAVSFSLYGLVRKVAPVGSLTGLTVETLLLAPAALVVLGLWQVRGASAFGTGNAALAGLLVLSGPVTAIPLLCFGPAARRLSLSLLGFLQYISPSISLVLAVSLYKEAFPLAKAISFGLIWTALAVFSLDSLRRPSAAVLPPQEVDPR